jgi:RND family efflux transporter MFP subunit
MNYLFSALKIVLPVGVLAAAGLGAYAIVLSKPEVPTQERPVELPGVRVATVTLEDVPLTVVSQGTVRPRTESQLVPEIAGQVIWVSPSFASGGFFEAGDPLLRIDPYDYQQAVVISRSQLAQARLRLAQEEAEAEVVRKEWTELGRGDATPLTLREPQLADARAAVAAAEAALDRAMRDLDRAEMTAPYAGRVRTKNVDVGQFLTVGSPVATIYAVDAAELRLPLPDGELAYLDLPLAYRGRREEAAGPRVTLRATFGGSAHTWQGRIVRTEAEIDPVSRMVHVVARVNDPYGPGSTPGRPPLAVGMFVEAEIQGRVARQVAVLPRAALRGRNQVIVVDDDQRLRFRDVTVFRSTTTSVIVSAGVSPGERVVVSPIEAATNGMRVAIVGDAEGS